MHVTDRQVRKLFMEYQKTGQIQIAAMKAEMDRDTAAVYVASGQLPSERKIERDWRTKPDPFERYWPEVEAKLKDAPELEAKALFEWLTERHPGVFQEGLLSAGPQAWGAPVDGLHLHERTWDHDQG